ncbi:MAG: methionyl-tRNA formyltransferase [Burkholderiaceae bacterium]
MTNATRPRVVFAGTPEFAARALAALHQAGVDIPLVLTQPDRPAGRGMKLQASAVKQYAQAQGLPVLQPTSLKKGADAGVALERLRQIFAQASTNDCMVVAAYGLLLPQSVLDLPPRGCINIHASLLPRWRGAAPIQRAIEAGDQETGVTLMQMEAGLDTGPMLLHQAIPILPDDTSASLHDKLADLGAQLIVRGLQQPALLVPQLQPQQGVTYAHKIEKSEAALDFDQPAEVLQRRIRAFNPFPGACGDMQGELIKFWQAHALKVTSPAPPGSIIGLGGDGVDVACGQGVLRLTELQKAGGKRLMARDFLVGQHWAMGMRFNHSSQGVKKPPMT